MLASKRDPVAIGIPFRPGDLDRAPLDLVKAMDQEICATGLNLNRQKAIILLLVDEAQNIPDTRQVRDNLDSLHGADFGKARRGWYVSDFTTRANILPISACRGWRPSALGAALSPAGGTAREDVVLETLMATNNRGGTVSAAAAENVIVGMIAKGFLESTGTSGMLRVALPSLATYLNEEYRGRPQDHAALRNLRRRRLG